MAFKIKYKLTIILIIYLVFALYGTILIQLNK